MIRPTYVGPAKRLLKEIIDRLPDDTCDLITRQPELLVNRQEYKAAIAEQQAYFKWDDKVTESKIWTKHFAANSKIEKVKYLRIAMGPHNRMTVEDAVNYVNFRRWNG